MRRAFPFSAFALLAATACAQGESGNSPKKTSPEGAAEAKSQAATAPDDGTGPAATVNGVDIPRELFNREYTQTMERYKKARHDVRPGLKERLKDNIVRRLVDMELIRQQAEKMGVSLSEEEKTNRWAEHRKRYGSDEAFQAFLERAGTTEEDIQRQFNANLLREKVFAKVAASVEVTDEEVRKFYDENLSRYTEPEQVKAKHILFRKPPNAEAKAIDGIKAKANKVLKLARRGKKSFEDLAKEYSEDVTKTRGGELGWFAKGRMVKPFEEAAWALKDGQVSDIVETTFGFHLIKREGFREARTKPFKEVEPLIRRSLTARKRNQAIQDAIKTWREESTIVVNIKGDPEIIKQDSRRPPAAKVKAPGLKVQPVPRPDPRTTPMPDPRTGPPKQ